MKFNFKNILCCILLCGGFSIPCSLAAADTPARITTSFDPNWRFLQKSLDAGQDIALDESTWQKLDVPHDWSIEGPIA